MIKFTVEKVSNIDLQLIQIRLSSVKIEIFVLSALYWRVSASTKGGIVCIVTEAAVAVVSLKQKRRRHEEWVVSTYSKVTVDEATWKWTQKRFSNKRLPRDDDVDEWGHFMSSIPFIGSTRLYMAMHETYTMPPSSQSLSLLYVLLFFSFDHTCSFSFSVSPHLHTPSSEDVEQCTSVDVWDDSKGSKENIK